MRNLLFYLSYVPIINIFCRGCRICWKGLTYDKYAWIYHLKTHNLTEEEINRTIEEEF